MIPQHNIPVDETEELLLCDPFILRPFNEIRPLLGDLGLSGSSFELVRDRILKQKLSLSKKYPAFAGSNDEKFVKLSELFEKS